VPPSTRPVGSPTSGRDRPRDGSPSAPRVRRIRPEEWARLRDLRLAALLESPEAFSTQHAEERLRPEAYWQERARREAGSREAATWVAELPGGRWVGMAVLRAAEGAWHLNSLWVAPDARRSGIGRRLVLAVAEAAEEREPGAVLHLDVNAALTPALELYRSLGFLDTGVTAPLRVGSTATRVSMVRPAARAGSP
jgi:ribosomal protein S18 acetylase RimI-like enzyme